MITMESQSTLFNNHICCILSTTKCPLLVSYVLWHMPNINNAKALQEYLDCQSIFKYA